MTFLGVKSHFMTSKVPAYYKRLREVFGACIRNIGFFAYLCKQIVELQTEIVY
jgi:hypothetical protein